MCHNCCVSVVLYSLKERECVCCVCVMCVYYVSLEVEQFVSLSLSRMLFFSIDENCMKCLFSLSPCECFMRVSPPLTRA